MHPQPGRTVVATASVLIFEKNTPMNTRITELFNIKYPLIQGGMIWCSGWKLAAAVSNAGGLGLIGAGSMYPEVLEEHLHKIKKATTKPFGVNIPLLYPDIEKIIQCVIEHSVPIVFTSAGNPAKYTSLLQSHGIKVAHVVPSTKLAIKCENAGVDAIVAEGFEAGGHNGREETTSLALIPAVRASISLPLIAAGGIGSGAAMLAAMALGADGVQIGSLFAASEESSAHLAFKQKIKEAEEGDTRLSLKKIVPVRLLRNPFAESIRVQEELGADKEKLAELLGTRRAKRGMFEGDIENGELEIGQVSAQIREILPATEILERLITEYDEAKNRINNL